MNRKLKNHLATAILTLCAITGIGIFLTILTAVITKGIHAINWSFLTSEIQQAGAAGGILPNLIGTSILLLTATITALPISIATAFLIRYFRPNGKLTHTIETLLYILNGIPSILIGILGFTLFVRDLDIGKSWLIGGILLGIMIVPTITIILAERITAIPDSYTQAARGLGMSESATARKVTLPRCWSSIITGLLLGLARAAGETAPILFTATVFSGASIPDGIADSPVLSLPYHIFVLAQDSLELASGNLWGAALVLLILVFTLSLIALPIRLKTHDESRHA